MPVFFFFNDPATTEIYTLSLHDALPISATVCAYLWLRSGYIPKTLAAFGLVASAWCVFCAFVFLIFPHFNEVVNDYWFDSPLAIFELVVSFWILFKGLKKGDDSEVNYVNAGSTKSLSLQLPVFL